jgi:hypothetical protein
MNLSIELKKSIADHLDKIRSHLGNLPADEQTEILQSVEAHIYDALLTKAENNPALADLEAILAEMDPPESYGELPPPQKRTFSWRIGIAALSGIILVIAAIKWCPTSIPQDPTGRWACVDFVASPEQFDPKTKSWRGELTLKGLTFLPEGKTDRLFWTWEEGVLHHSGDSTDAKFFIRKIGQERYLFLEWISGDVIYRGIPPNYYVLKRTESEMRTQ